MYKLKVKVGKRTWKYGIKVYGSFHEALERQKELKALKIESIIIPL